MLFPRHCFYRGPWLLWKICSSFWGLLLSEVRYRLLGEQKMILKVGTTAHCSCHRMCFSSLDPVIFHNFSWHKQYTDTTHSRLIHHRQSIIQYQPNTNQHTGNSVDRQSISSCLLTTCQLSISRYVN